MKNAKTGKSAFTLLELLVVLGIMALLGGLGMSGLSGIRAWMQNQAERTYFSEIQAALRLYYHDHRTWPAGFSTSECDLRGEGAGLMEDLQPYMESPLNRDALDREFAGKQVLVVVDNDRDHWIKESDFSRLGTADRPERIWERVAVYSLDTEGTLANCSWNHQP